MFEQLSSWGPQYAEASRAWGCIRWQGSFNGVRSYRELEQALALVQQAMALDDSLPSAHILSMGSIYLKAYEQARAEAERMITLAPTVLLAIGR